MRFLVDTMPEHSYDCFFNQHGGYLPACIYPNPPYSRDHKCDLEYCEDYGYKCSRLVAINYPIKVVSVINVDKE
jgi:hypothetical protein